MPRREQRQQCIRLLHEVVNALAFDVSGVDIRFVDKIELDDVLVHVRIFPADKAYGLSVRVLLSQVVDTLETAFVMMLVGKLQQEYEAPYKPPLLTLDY